MLASNHRAQPLSRSGGTRPEFGAGLAYNEPQAWYYPVRESLAASLNAVRRFQRSGAVFREGLQKCPHDGRMLFGLLESLKLPRAWKDADLKLDIGSL
jgi:hypothetical protein